MNTTSTVVEGTAGDRPDLSGVIVGLDDLPRDFAPLAWDDQAAIPSASDDSYGEDGDPCTIEDPTADLPPDSQAHSEFGSSSLGVIVSSGAARLPSVAAAERMVDAHAQAAAPGRCELEVLTPDGSGMIMALRSHPFPSVGDSSAAGRMSGWTPGGTLTMDLVLARQGAVVVYLIIGGPEPADPKLAVRLMRSMVDRARWSGASA